MHLLIVDDGPEFVMALGHILMRAGHTYTGAHSPAEAMRVLRREGRHISRPMINLALLDHHMGAHSGLELLEQLQGDEAFAPLPVVMLSNSQQPSVVEQAYGLGCCGWVAKDALLNKDTIGTILSYWERCERIEI